MKEGRSFSGPLLSTTALYDRSQGPLDARIHRVRKTGGDQTGRRSHCVSPVKKTVCIGRSLAAYNESPCLVGLPAVRRIIR